MADSDPNVVYAGMGEGDIRGNASHGDGVYKSTDAGHTWAHVGLTATQQIGALRIDPKNPDVVYVAALTGITFSWASSGGIERTFGTIQERMHSLVPIPKETSLPSIPHQNPLR